jgi:hypothetical protein
MSITDAAVRHRHIRVPALARRVLPLGLLFVALSATSAQAHTAAATATCSSATLNWAAFAASGSTNGGLNTPDWKLVFTPASGASTTKSGKASFAGATSTMTVALPAGNGSVTASSSWTAAQTRDASSGSFLKVIAIADCPPVTVPLPPPPAPLPPPAPVTVPVPVPAPAPAPVATPSPAGTAGSSVVAGQSAPCTEAAKVLLGVVAVARHSVKAHIASSGVKRVTFMLDGKQRKSSTTAKNHRFSITVNVNKVAYGKHELTAKVTMKSANCASARLAGTFVRARSAAVSPAFTG